ncbi:hypothetical protein NADFUDRAFT_64674 [Nadsonia fulvescens var. elongata DSM 6958]|uniref:RING-type domain-containing protein n=1 Tax=Nadsonia fulvescens var. elongata DSM 6958 TaxID=857566 RepID=A0A1E3PQ40_9ASCO|nr:hypothetical protein NADFUDRAFT_64674 [Nadsonia fulvescens var. elongata DSM 6958]
MGNVQTKEIQPGCATKAVGSGRKSLKGNRANSAPQRHPGRQHNRYQHHRSSSQFKELINQGPSIRSTPEALDRTHGRDIIVPPQANRIVLNHSVPTLDHGYLEPQGIYSNKKDYDIHKVHQFIIERKLAPFFKGLADFDSDWNGRQLLAAIRGLPVGAALSAEDDHDVDDNHTAAVTESKAIDIANSYKVSPKNDNCYANQNTLFELSNSAPKSRISVSLSDESLLSPNQEGFGIIGVEDAIRARRRSNTTSQYKVDNSIHDQEKQQVEIYRECTECPICFLCYPSFTNKTICCHQPICTECFLQIKRSEPHAPTANDGSNTQNGSTSNNRGTPTGSEAVKLVSEPACCPYCTVPEFGVAYNPPPLKLRYQTPGLQQHINEQYYHHKQNLRHHAHNNNERLSKVKSQIFKLHHSAPSAIKPGKLKQSLLSSSASLASKSDEFTVTTDQVRPNWKEVLNQANDEAAHRTAAINAYHNITYVAYFNSQERAAVTAKKGKKLRKRDRAKTLFNNGLAGSNSNDIEMATKMPRARRNTHTAISMPSTNTVPDAMPSPEIEPSSDSADTSASLNSSSATVFRSRSTTMSEYGVEAFPESQEVVSSPLHELPINSNGIYKIHHEGSRPVVNDALKAGTESLVESISGINLSSEKVQSEMDNANNDGTVIIY